MDHCHCRRRTGFLYTFLNGGLYLRDKALIPLIPLFCYMLAMYLKKVSCEGVFVGRLYSICCHDGTYLYRKKPGRNGKSVPFLMTESQIMFWLLSGNRCDKKKRGENEGRQSGELEEQF